jgi:5'-methylthioadenosine phosphorylase
VTTLADVAVIGGSGLYALLDGAAEHRVDTPYGAPSDPITVAEVNGRPTAFLPRHGKDHRYPPHRIPYRANLWALHSIGVRQILAPCAVGGLRPEFGPGTFVLPDQLIDRTSGRIQTFYDEGAVHVNFADPYCPTGRAAIQEASQDAAQKTVPSGTMVVIEGPRVSTRAESRWYASIGGSVVNMTGHPEAVLARELAICYTAIAIVTDLDAGVEGDHGVTQEEVFRVFGENIARVRDLLLDTIGRLPEKPDDACQPALDGLAPAS